MLLLMLSTSYRASDFLDAAGRLGVDVVVGSNHCQVLEKFSSGGTLTVRFDEVASGVEAIVAHARRHPVAAIVGTDEDTTVLAAAASEALGLPHNSTASVIAAHGKDRFRQALAEAGVRCPWFALICPQDDLAEAARAATYPCVLKPLSLSASRGVIRVDDEAGFIAAARRIAVILRGLPGDPDPRRTGSILAEGFIPGREVAVEGLLEGGRLTPLAVFDKPDPLDGPFFEETLYVTPSRLPEGQQEAIVAETAAAAQALGLAEGPIHAELRLNDEGPWVIELAARSIGGLCSRALTFANGATLEELILRHTLGLPMHDLAREDRAAGVMMIPIPRGGRLDAVEGLDAARSVPGIEDVIISIPIGDYLVPLPEGDRYLGFIFAGATTPVQAERALRRAHAGLSFDISAEAS